MKNKRCPYCGRRISYFTIFHEKKHGLYKCTRCKKESKIKTDARLLIAFAVEVLLVIVYLILWQNSGFYNNFLGVLPPVVLIVGFYFFTPLFVRFVPLKKEIEKEEKSREKIPEISEEVFGGDYVFNRDAFERIKQQRKSTTFDDDPILSKLDNAVKEIEEEPYVPIIRDVSEAHASSDAPLKKVNHQVHDKPREPEYEPETFEEDVKTYVPHKQKPDGSKYTANRKF